MIDTSTSLVNHFNNEELKNIEYIDDNYFFERRIFKIMI